MNILTRFFAIFSFVIIFAASSLSAGEDKKNKESESIIDAMVDGTFKGSLRPRLETVDQEGIDKTARATTLRAALQYTTGTWKGFQLKTELEAVTGFVSEEYNSKTNKETEYPVVADPSGGHVNKLFLSFKTDDFLTGLGRDEIIYDNSRWVGNVGWRQNHQTFESARIDGKFDKFTYHLAYITKRLNVITYASSKGQDLKNSYLLNGAYSLSFGKISAYIYSHETDDDKNIRTKTSGGFLSSKPKEKYIYRLEVASQQKDKANLGKQASAMYYHFKGGLKTDAFTAVLGYEKLASDEGNYGVLADFGTNHKFNGFADQFLKTPKEGLKDLYATVIVPVKGVKIVATYHDFKPALKFKSDDPTKFTKYGTEIDFVLATKINKQINLLGKYANYSADSNANNPKNKNVSKVMLMATYSF